MTTTSRTRKLTKVGSGAAGLGLAVMAVLGFSNAAFNVQMDPNEQNNWAADGAEDYGVTLEDVNAGVEAPLFSFGLNGAPRPKDGNRQLATFDGLLTDDPAELNADDPDAGRVLSVRYTGKEAANVRMYAEYDAEDVTNGLDQHTIVTVSREGNEIFTGTLDELTDPTAVDEWYIPADASGAPKVSAYKVTIQTDAAAENPGPTGTVEDVSFIWEATQA